MTIKVERFNATTLNIDSVPSTTIDEWVRTMKDSWWLSPFDGGIQKPSLADPLLFCLCCHETEMDPETLLKQCKQCGVATYCCKGCQAEHWRAHKKSCKVLKHIADKGKGAAELPIDAFEDTLA